MVRSVLCRLLLPALLFVAAPLAFSQTATPAPADAFRIAQRLMQAKPEERPALLDQNRALISMQTQRYILDRGEGLLASGQYAQALETFQLALTVAERIDDREGVAAAHSSLGSAQYFQGDHARARQSYQTARRLYETLGNQKEVATNVFNLGLTTMAQGDVSAATQFFQQAQTQYESLGLKELAAEAMNYLATMMVERGDYSAALKLFAGRSEGAPGLLKIAESLYYQEEYEHALDFFRQALDALQQQAVQTTVHRARLLSALNGVANSQYSLGDYEPALDSYLKLCALREQSGDRAGLAAALQGVANCFYALSDYEQALENYQTALAVAQQAGHQAIIAETLAGLGNVQYSQGEAAQALEFYQRSLRQFEITGDKAGLRRMLRSTANAHFRLGSYAASLAAFQQCLKLTEEAGDKDDAASVKLGIGLVYAVQARFAEALENYRQALAQFEAAGHRSQQALAWYRIALVYTTQEDYAQALSFAERAVTLATQSDALDTLWRAQFETGRIQKRQLHLPEARRAFEQSIATVEKLRARSAVEQEISSDTVLPYLAMVSLHAEENNSLAAFSYAERAKALSLWTLLQNSRALPTKGLLPAEIEREQKLRKQITTISARLARARQRPRTDKAALTELSEQLRLARADYATFLNRLYQRHPQLKIYRGELTALKPAEAARLLTDHHALIEYVVTDEATWMFVLTRERQAGPAAVQLSLRVGQINITAADLISRVLQFRQSIINKDESYAATARELYDLLLRPATVELAGKSALTIIPDSALWSLPFAALQSAGNRFLIEDCALSFAPSLTALREMKKRSATMTTGKAAAPALLVIAGNPQPASASSAGQEVEDETQRISKLYGTRHRLLSGAQFSPDALKAETARAGVIHLAAPLSINHARPLHSFLTLTPGHSADGRWRVRELLSLETKARVMVFANSGAPPDALRLFSGYGGLSWLALIAGAPSVVAGQWTGTGDSTDELMAEFHQAVAAGQPVAAALQRAALKLRHSAVHQHPFYWSGLLALSE